MSLLTPERVPVKVYRWDDVGAPQLDKTPNCMATIFKACLVTGYGTKEGAGWTLPFEDTAAGVKVLRPAVSPHPDFDLRLSADTGTEMAAQVYLNMTDANTGDLKLQCATAFKYAKSKSSGRWLLIASPYGFWFFNEQQYGSFQAEYCGSYFYVGVVASLRADVGDAIYLQHTGGSNNNGEYTSIFRTLNKPSGGTDANYYVAGKMLLADGSVVDRYVRTFADWEGDRTRTIPKMYISAFVYGSLLDVYTIPGVLVPSMTGNNLDEAVVANTHQSNYAIAFNTTPTKFATVYVVGDTWEYP